MELGLQSPPPSTSIASPRVYDYRSRAGSQASFESLPAYDENRSPTYEERAPLLTQERPESQRSNSNNWRSQLLITTSGLGAALSESSLKSLRYCLSILRSAFDHVATVANALKSLLDDYENSQQQNQTNGVTTNGAGLHLTPEQQHNSNVLAERIQSLGADIMKTVQSVVNAVNTYTGSALPENAAALVRRQLLSIPHRMRTAETNASTVTSPTEANSGHLNADNLAIRSGRKWLDFATQSLDMIEQVNLVVSGTIRSAERWLESMGRKKEEISTPTPQEKQTNGVHVNGVNEKS